MSLKGLIFDLEGVIVFTDQYHYKAWDTVVSDTPASCATSRIVVLSFRYNFLSFAI